jgi:hypothetical protein
MRINKMAELIFFMHVDTVSEESSADWENYIGKLIASGHFQGGSSIGNGFAYRKGHVTVPASDQINGFIRLEGINLENAGEYLDGNPTYEAGGKIEVRELIS